MEDSKRPHANNPLNVAFRRLMENHRLDDAKAQRALGIYTAAAIGNYRRGDRPISSKLIDRWEEVFSEDIRQEAKTIIKTNVSRETTLPAKSAKEMFDKATENEAISGELWKQLQKDHDLFEKELERAWALIDRLLPGGGGSQSVKSISSKDR